MNTDIIDARADIVLQDQGTIVLFTPNSDAGEDWISEYIPHAMTYGPASVVEHRYAYDVYAGMNADGLLIQVI